MSDDQQVAPATVSRKTGNVRKRVALFAAFLADNDRVLNVLSTTLTAIFTIVLATSTVLLWKETKDLRDLAQEQGADMKASIAEAARAAVAMQDVATAVGASAKASSDSLAVYKDANTRQMRAYVTLGLGSVVQQDAATNYRFEVRMNLQNVGNTPAYKLVSDIHVGLFPFPLPADFQIPTPVEVNSGGDVVGPHQSFIITGIAESIYSDDDVKEISAGSQKRMYVYGTIKYEDAFGLNRYVKYCQAILWMKGGNFMSRNMPLNNDSN
jgi:hypothetical protein